MVGGRSQIAFYQGKISLGLVHEEIEVLHEGLFGFEVLPVVLLREHLNLNYDPEGSLKSNYSLPSNNRMSFLRIRELHDSRLLFGLEPPRVLPLRSL